MSSIRPLRSREPDTESEPPSLHGRAMDNLRFIRETMERASSFTAVPGWGGVGIGVTAIVAAIIASRIRDEHEWMYVWAWELPLALLIGGLTMKRKAGGAQLKMLSAPGRKITLSPTPPPLARAFLSVGLGRARGFKTLARMWVVVYRAGGVCR